MKKHRVDINLKGTSYYVDGQFQNATGFPFQEGELPHGLHLERRVGRPPDKSRKLVRTKEFGRSVEWTSDRHARGSQGAEHQAGQAPERRRGPPPGQPRGRFPGPERGDPRGQGPQGGPGEEEERDLRQDPGLFDVPEGDFDNNDDAYFMVPSRRDDSRASRGFLHRNERQEEARPHGPKEHSDNAHSWMLDRDGGGSHSRSFSRQDIPGALNYQDRRWPLQNQRRVEEAEAYGPRAHTRIARSRVFDGDGDNLHSNFHSRQDVPETVDYQGPRWLQDAILRDEARLRLLEGNNGNAHSRAPFEMNEEKERLGHSLEELFRCRRENQQKEDRELKARGKKGRGRR